MNNNEAYIGIDIGGTNTVIGLIKNNGQYLKKLEFPTNSTKQFDVYYQTLRKNIDSLFNNNIIKGIGIGVPAANSMTGIVENPENFNWGKINLHEIVSRDYKIPISVINDAKAAALGEMAFGNARDLKNFIQITLGTGLGCSFVFDGKIVNGQNGLAGELGHTKICNNQRQCACGRRGCLETYVSASGVCRTAFELICSEKNESHLRNLNFNELSAKIITNHALKNDLIAIETYRITGKILGEKLADIITVFNPQAILFSGGLVSVGKFLFEPVKEAIDNNLLHMHKNTVELRVSDTKINYAVLGAASLVIQ
jgi:glucokinase